jgi:hypothetical protein
MKLAKGHQKTHFSRTVRTGVFQSKFDEVGRWEVAGQQRALLPSFRDPQNVGKRAHCRNGGRIGAKKLFCNPIDLHRLLARSSYLITVGGAFWQFLQVSELFRQSPTDF